MTTVEQFIVWRHSSVGSDSSCPHLAQDFDELGRGSFLLRSDAAAVALRHRLVSCLTLAFVCLLEVKRCADGWRTRGSCTKIRLTYGIRNQEPPEINGGHLQATPPGKIPAPAWTSGRIHLEFEGVGKNSDVTRWDQFTDIKDIKKEMLRRLEAHFEKWLNP
jgi:hypothetical protein